MNHDQQKQIALETETLCYKQFMKVAKKVSYLQYGKWQIVPSAIDPLRKFTLEKDCGWVTIKLALHMDQFYHRGKYGPERYGWRAELTMTGIFKDMTSGREHITKLGMKLKPRMAKKLIRAVDEAVIPKLHALIELENQQHITTKLEAQAFSNKVSLVNGLKIEVNKNSYDRRMVGRLSNCPFDIAIDKDNVTMTGIFKYEDLALMAERMGWGL